MNASPKTIVLSNILLCLLFVVLCYAMITISNKEEISAERYQNLIGVPAKYVEPYMEDGKITNAEYEKIVKAYSKDEFNRTQETNNGI